MYKIGCTTWIIWCVKQQINTKKGRNHNSIVNLGNQTKTLGFLANIRKSPAYIKWTQWEYWPMYAFYIPVFPYYLYLAAKAGHPFFFVAANPAIKSGGSGFESKYDTIQLLPKKWAPKTVFVHQFESSEKLKNLLKTADIQFPLIAKPDVGFRGLLVEKIHEFDHLERHLRKHQIAFIIQEFIETPIEFSVFYHRIPGESGGIITSLTIKEFMQIKGDGIRTFGKLLTNMPRAKMVLEDLQLRYKHKWHTIPQKGKKIKVVEIGNHARGTRFINGNHLIDSQLLKIFDELNHLIPGWHYGRVDVRANDIDALKSGQFKIIEINGVLSEPTHIYDSTKTNYFHALKEIRRHWKILYQVATLNHKMNGAIYESPSQFIKNTIGLFKYVKLARKTK